LKEVCVEIPVRVPVEYEKRVEVPVTQQKIIEIPVETHTTETRSVEIVMEVPKHIIREASGMHR
jgi:hypothetical protein